MKDVFGILEFLDGALPISFSMFYINNCVSEGVYRYVVGSGDDIVERLNVCNCE